MTWLHFLTFSNRHKTAQYYHFKNAIHTLHLRCTVSFQYSHIIWYNRQIILMKWLIIIKEVTVALLLMHNFMETDDHCSMFRSWNVQWNTVDLLMWYFIHQTICMWSHVLLFQTLFSVLTLLYVSQIHKTVLMEI